MKFRRWLKEKNISTYKVAKDLGMSQSLIHEVSVGKKYLSPALALKIEEYTRQIDPDNYIRATELINPKKLEEFKLLQKVAK